MYTCTHSAWTYWTHYHWDEPEWAPHRHVKHELCLSICLSVCLSVHMSYCKYILSQIKFASLVNSNLLHMTATTRTETTRTLGPTCSVATAMRATAGQQRWWECFLSIHQWLQVATYTEHHQQQQQVANGQVPIRRLENETSQSSLPESVTWETGCNMNRSNVTATRTSESKYSHPRVLTAQCAESVCSLCTSPVCFSLSTQFLCCSSSLRSIHCSLCVAQCTAYISLRVAPQCPAFHCSVDIYIHSNKSVQNKKSSSLDKASQLRDFSADVSSSHLVARKQGGL